MSLDDLLQQDMICTGISFNFDGIELTFLEKRDQGDTVTVGKVISMDVNENDAELFSYYEQLQEIACRMIERGLTDLRNPTVAREPVYQPGEIDDDGKELLEELQASGDADDPR